MLEESEKSLTEPKAKEQVADEGFQCLSFQYSSEL